MTPSSRGSSNEALVRDQDPDRFVSVPFAPPERRPALLALYAFNIEIASVRERVSQPMPGEIRLQWWRDLLRTAAGDPAAGGQGHPVAESLLAAIRAHDLPFDAFDRMIEARIFDLYDDPMPSRAAFEGYAGDTASALIMLAAMILDRDAAPGAADAAGHAGVSQAAAGALRLLPIHRRRGQTVLPADLMAAAGCSPEELRDGAAEPTARVVAAAVAFAREHQRRFERQWPNLPRSIRPAFLPAQLTPLYLDRLERRGSGLDTIASVGPLRRSFLYWQRMRR
ncbi:phytoene/squalene synthase family protein [Mangrovibrevibacter kandeliae]|uniref:phytoene/squalene synthase family protein n=1 Tax=Mangrovibrevibacter kandeliae TaxID=2968473 RepID=UPI002117392B|nr:phytoene/squalene synthase family protein [Aurantimonas sp. CSK15Z-1]MCQ8781767.1 phytoene/squalene synthase family protein [Aurantimonas sp. CSK15Z-1]